MKNLKVILIVLFILNSPLFAESDLNGLQHNIEKVPPAAATTNRDMAYIDSAYKDIKEDQKLSLRKLQAKKIYGDVETIGATVLIQQPDGFNFNPTFQNGGSVIQNFKFIREDLRISKNSSKASFNFPEKTSFEKENIDGSKVIFARLYWAGGISTFWNHSDPTDAKEAYFKEIKDFNTITFGTHDNTYPLIAEENDTKWYGSYHSRGMQFMYQASVDVTEIVKNSLGKNINSRTFSAGNIKAKDQHPYPTAGYRDDYWIYPLSGAHYGGWALVIVYDFETDKKPDNTPNGVKPKGVYIFDGLQILAPIKPDEGETEKTKTAIFPIEGFFTPASGDIKSSLTVLSFGGKVETDAENIEIKRASDGTYHSVTSNYNSQGQQFNSSITNFGKHMNPNKQYNNQMDLDIYNLKDHISHKQTKTEIKLTAKVKRKGGYTLGERANVGLVIFATEFYEPEVCYIENLQFRGRNKTEDSDFVDVSTDSSDKTIAKNGDTLRVKLRVINRGEEEAYKTGLKSILNEKGIKYIENTTHINPSAPRDSNTFSPSHNKDNEGLQKVNNNVLDFSIGQDAQSNEGGILHKRNEAHIQFDTTLGKDFKYDDYVIHEAIFRNDKIGFSYKGKIKKCEKKDYYIEVAGISNIVVNDKFNKIDDSRRFFTQLAGRKFNAKLLNILTKKNGQVLENFDISDKEKIVVDIIDSGDCLNGQNIMTNPPFVYLRKDIADKKIIDIKNILINKAYTSLFFRITYLDENNKIIGIPSCSSDPFSVRPKELKFYNNDNKTDSFGNLIGGKRYKNIWLQAIDANNAISENYTTTVKPINFQISSSIPATCNVTNFNFLSSYTLKADFKNGKGEVQRLVTGLVGTETTEDFIYPNVGDVEISAKDSTWTMVDQHSPESPDSNDCIVGSSSIQIDSKGKIGCDIKSANDLNLKFIPNDILVDDLKISNFNNGTMTYMSNDENMIASANFNISARLHPDSGSIPATLYTNKCYSRNVNLSISMDSIIEDITDKDGNALSNDTEKVKQANKDIIYFKSNNTNFVKKNNTPDNNSQYTAKAEGFNNGVATVSIPFNFGKNITAPKNPFAVNSKIFQFKDISDTDSVAGATYEKPDAANETKADFYYGRVYAPKKSGPKKGFDHNVYFGVYCNLCDTDKYTIAKNAELFPDQTNWFVNKEHDDINMGEVKNYKPNSPSTNVSVTKSVQDGIEKIFLSSSIPGSDTIKMEASSWLLFNQVDKNAKTNDFIVEFTDGTVWGGQSLNKKGENKAGVGSVIGGSKLEDIPSQTNRRLEW
ncbi:hypothetical protein [Campylobacter sp. RM16190]|uniref:hypothetical protein n=1 Tax=Campylobacter sp. RM16190 TaxID=1705727 RepID=UPI001473687A|nr:hypothetical protein [Campylobacter sp. RM16190]